MDKEMGFGTIFTKIYSSAGIGHLKMNPEFFNQMIEDMRANYIPDIQAEEILFFDDTEENVQGAKDAGVEGVLFSGIDGFKEQLEKFSV